jgi:glycerate kinase
MKIVVALDSFKGSLTAIQACTVVAEAIRSLAPKVRVVCRPMADGGEGTAAVLMAAAGGQSISSRVMGPLPEMEVEAGFVWLANSRTAVVEMAAASGLPLLQPKQRNPLNTTTYGTGQLIRAAIERGADHILLTVGGSATVDGGAGAAVALGWKFLAKDQREITPAGGQLAQIDRIVPLEHPLGVAVKVLCDVDNPLCGERGAARVYGPQKGATPEMVEMLDAGLAHLARLVREQLGRDVASLPGAGAAGGLAAGAVAFMDARLVSGIETVIARTHLRRTLVGADWVVTGEGCFDGQSLQGKVVSGVVQAAGPAGAKVAVLAGQVCLSPEEYRPAGVETAIPCMEDGMDPEYAISHGELLLDRAARRFVRNAVALP